MKYRPEIDGLRAIAVLPVILFHGGLSLISGGFIGVDIFFVISGYLITSIIYKEIEAGEFSFINFYERRVRRILPALYFVLLTCLPAAWFFLIPRDLIDFSKSLMGVVSFISNIVFWQQLDYFSAGSDYIPLLHTWSLAIEEQYYFFFPLLLIVLYRFSTKVVLVSLAALFTLSLVISDLGSIHKPSATYYLLPTRFWELLVGSFIALMIRHNTLGINQLNKTNQNILSFLGFGLIIAALFVIDETIPFPGRWALMPTLGAGLIILFANKGTLINKLLSMKLLVGIGLISYSAYLWHQPIYVFLRHQHLIPKSNTVMAIGFFASLALAFVSWKYIEAPFRNKTKMSRSFAFSICGIFSLLLLFAGWLGVHNNGFKNRFKLHPALSENSFTLPKSDNGFCFYSVDTNSTLKLGEEGIQCRLGANKPIYKGILLGDSFAGMYEPFWQQVGIKHSININAVTTNWCYPAFSDNFYWPNETPAREQCSYNRQYVKSQLNNVDLIIIAGVWNNIPPDHFLEVLSLIEAVTQNTKTKVVIMAQPGIYTRTSVMRSVYVSGQLVNGIEEEKAIEANAKLKKIASQNSQVLFISREAMFTSEKNGDIGHSDTGAPYSLDGAHISIYGSLAAADNYIESGKSNTLLQFLKRSH